MKRVIHYTKCEMAELFSESTCLSSSDIKTIVDFLYLFPLSTVTEIYKVTKIISKGKKQTKVNQPNLKGF